MDEALAYAKAVLEKLQDAARKRRREIDDLDALAEGQDCNMPAAGVVKRRLANAQLKELLRELSKLHNAVNEVLQGCATDVNGTLTEDWSLRGATALRQAVDKWKSHQEVEELLDEEGLDLDSVSDDAQREHERVAVGDRAAAEALLHVDARPGAGSQASIVGPQASKLPGVLTSLRAFESTALMHARLSADVKEAASSGSYSTGNFAYGSTPFTSWLKIMRHPEVWPYIQAKAAAGDTYVVWGSSIGWLVFYGALALGMDSHGYDILPSLVEIAEQIREIHRVSGASFVCRDMLGSNLRGVGVIMLASQCWDKELVAAAASKLQAELPQGAIVIDYTDSLREALGAPVAVIEIEVSWNPRQRMCVFLKQ